MKNYIIACCHRVSGIGPQLFLRSLERMAGTDQVDVILIGDSAQQGSSLPVTWVPLRWVQGNPIMDRFHSMLGLKLNWDDRVILTDIRDVVFQSNPFRELFWSNPAERGRVHVFAEDCGTTLDKESSNSSWLRALNGNSLPGWCLGKSIICAGVIAGEWRSVYGYLSRLCFQMLQRPAFFGLDQALHNMYVHNDIWAFVVHTNEHGPVSHLVLVKSPQYNPDGMVINASGGVPAIVHQYDRHPDLMARIEKRWGVICPS